MEGNLALKWWREEDARNSFKYYYNGLFSLFQAPKSRYALPKGYLGCTLPNTSATLLMK
jgi:hypothetical protein